MAPRSSGLHYRPSGDLHGYCIGANLSHAAFTEAEVAEAEACGVGPYRRYGVKTASRLLGLEYSVVRRLIAKSELGMLKVESGATCWADTWQSTE